jgi:hypothetical protein
MLLLAILFTLCYSQIELPVGCNIIRIATCLNQHVDLDGDHKINATEVDEYIYAAPCGPPFSNNYNGVDVVAFFDMNNDSYIDLSDLEYDQTETGGRKSLFVGTDFQQIVRAACLECDSCDFNLI